MLLVPRPSPAANLLTVRRGLARMAARAQAALVGTWRWTGRAARVGLERAQPGLGAPWTSRNLASGIAADETGLRVRTIGEAAELVLAVVGLILIYRLSPFAIRGDGVARYDGLSMLLSRGEVSRTLYSLVGPLGATPLWLLGRLGGDPAWWVARYNFLLFAGSLVGFYLVFTPSLGRRITLRFLLLVTAASMFPNHLGQFYGEVFTALCVGLGLAIVVCRERFFTGWALVILGVANTPAALVGLAAAGTVLAWQRREARHLAPVLIAAALVAAEAYLRRGSPLATGYEGNAGVHTVLPYSGLPGFSYPLLLGLVSTLLSPGKGLLFFAPGLLLIPALWRRNSTARAMLVSWTAFLLGLLAVYAKWWAWYGGLFWGPRFFLFASLVAALATAAWLSSPRRSWPAEVAGALVVAWSCWVGVNGLVFGLWDTIGICTANNYAMEFLCWYVPEFSPLFRPMVAPGRISGPQSAALVYAALVGLYLAGGRLLRAAREWFHLTPVAAGPSGTGR